MKKLKKEYYKNNLGEAIVLSVIVAIFFGVIVLIAGLVVSFIVGNEIKTFETIMTFVFSVLIGGMICFVLHLYRLFSRKNYVKWLIESKKSFEESLKGDEKFVRLHNELSQRLKPDNWDQIHSSFSGDNIPIYFLSQEELKKLLKDNSIPIGVINDSLDLMNLYKEMISSGLREEWLLPTLLGNKQFQEFRKERINLIKKELARIEKKRP